MDHKEFRERLGQEILVFDGAMGTMLQAAGLPPGACPELWNRERPDVVRDIHRAYVEAGANIIETNTFGANRLKLSHYGLEGQVRELNCRGAQIAREASSGRALVAGSIGPTGQFVQPLGSLSFDEAYEIFAEQAEGLAEGGADLIIVETMADLGEARVAVMAAKERTGLPVVAQMTFGERGRTFTGTGPDAAAVVLEACGADVVGANCSLGPAELMDVVQGLASATALPLSVQPNAGIPRLVAGETVFPMGAEEFASWGPRLVASGAGLVGGCCGTSPEYIRLLASRVRGLRPSRRVRPFSRSRIGGREHPATTALASRGNVVFFREEALPVVIGERINPTGRKKLAADIISGAYAMVREDARAQVQAGAQVLDVNVGVPGIDEAAAMRQAVLAVQEAVDVPLCIDSPTPKALEEGLKACVGKALVNSASGEAGRLEAVLPLAKRFGAALVVLALDDQGIPPTAEGRLAVAERVLTVAREHGFPEQDLFIDCLCLAIGADQSSAIETLRAVRLVKERLGLRTILGLSNVSFGMPMRHLLNAAFFTMAMQNGLDAAIINPLDSFLRDALLASRVILGRDRGGLAYVSAMAGRNADVPPARTEPLPAARPGSTGVVDSPSSRGVASPGGGSETRRGWTDRLYRAVLDGEKDAIEGLVDGALAEGWDPVRLLNEVLIPAIEEVGRLFAAGTYFLPQLMLSAEAMKRGFNRLKPHMQRAAGAGLGTIVMATVEGDIHDIGKNIVCVLLENHGFRVVDLGRDVPADRILEVVRQEKADLVGLSALMTTTMPQMKKVIDLFRREGVRCPVIIGGAATDKEYAREIGAAGHARDASEAVEVAKRVLAAVRRGVDFYAGTRGT